MPTYAFMFPGQGSQKVGMGRELYDAFPSAKAVFDRADEALGFSLSKLCFEGPEDALMLTANTQPAILTCSIAALEAMRSTVDVKPTVALGHSLGEFSALVAVGALRFEDAVKLVRLRGEAMQAAVPAGTGAMAAIMGLSAERVDELCVEASGDEVVSPANENGGGQIVVAGHAAAVERLIGLVKANAGKAIPLKVSAPFHCALMQPAADALAVALQQVEVGPMSAAVITNVEAEPNRDPTRVKELLVRQVTDRVRWEASVLRAQSLGVDVGLEIGHGKVLAGLVKRIANAVRMVPVGLPADLDAVSVP